VTAPTAAATAIDIREGAVRFAYRSAWRALLGWPAECDESFNLMAREADDYGGVMLYPAGDGLQVAAVTCTVGPYWTQERYYLVDTRTTPPTTRLLPLQEMVEDGAGGWVARETEEARGLPTFHTDTRTLTNLAPYRGLKDCGVWYVYRLEAERFALVEARYRNCDDTGDIEESLSPQQWDLIDPAPATTAAPAGSAGLVYRISVDGRAALGIAAADGTGRRVIPLPDDAQVASLVQAVSPGGRWLAYHTGAAGGNASRGPSDLALNLMDLSGGGTRVITALLSAGYPDDAGSSQQWEALVYGIRALAWSPDGRRLAFAGQVEGPSSDVYVYDLDTGTIRRLTDGPGQVQSIAWSPDGRWILHTSASEVGAGAPAGTYAAAADGSAMRELPPGSHSARGWIAPATYLCSDANNGPAGLSRLRSVDLDTGAERVLWDGTFVSFAVDPENSVLAVAGYETVGARGAPALYLIDLAGGNRRKLAESVSRVEFLGAGGRQFVYGAQDGDVPKTMLIMADGSVAGADFGAGAVRVTASPDRRLLLAAGRELRVYAASGDLLRAIPLPGSAARVDETVWRPDSSGFFFRLGAELYAADVAGGDAVLVDHDLPDNAPVDWTWAGF
jgi:Tol biopolymer transport system component